MNEREVNGLIFFLIAYVVLNVFAMIKIFRNTQLSQQKKYLNGALIWLVPYFWSSVVVIFFSSPGKSSKSRSRYMEAGYRNYIRWGG